MKFKNLLFGFASSALVVSCIIFISNLQSNKANHQSIVSQDSPIAHGIRGAFEYYDHIRINPVTGKVDIKDVNAARKGVENLPTSKALNLQWAEMGPSNVGGRTRAILYDKSNSSIMYAGAVSGGLWKSTTSGQSWVQIPLVENIAVTCIAQGPDGTIYVGTGEGLANPSGTNFNSGQYGAGLFKSTNGINFSLLQSTANYNLINRVAVDKFNKVYIATSEGLKSSKDGGATWKNSKNGFCKDVKIAPNSYVAIASINGTVYIKSDTAEIWTQQTGLPSAGVSRVELAISPTDENYMYAVLVSNTGSLHSIYRTTDKGLNWSQIAVGGSPSFDLFGSNNQGWYDAAILVSASNKNVVYVGGISIWRGAMITSDAPFSWTQISSQGKLYGNGQPNPHYVHSDVHALVQNPSNPESFFVGCDGGLFQTSDNGNSFVSKNINYSVTQFYAIACSPNGWAMGGTQDNSTPYVDGKGNNPKEAHVLYGGDGGWAAFSSLNQKVLFATSQYGYTGRSNDNGDSWQRAVGVDGTTPEFFSQAMVTAGANSNSAFVTPFLLWETTHFPNSIDSVLFIADTTYPIGSTFYGRSKINNAYPFTNITNVNLKTGDTVKVQDPIQSRFYFGAKNAIYMTKEAIYYGKNSPTWYKIAGFTGTVWTMSISKDGDVLYFAIDTKLYRISNLLQAQDLSTAEVGQANYALCVDLIKNFSGVITSIGIDPSSSSKVAVTLGGFSSSYKHLWYSQNATTAAPVFVDKSGNLPATLPIYSCIIPINNPNTIIVGTEYGVMATDNLNTSSPIWSNQNTGIDNPVPVFMIRQQIYEQPWMKVGRWDGGVLVSQVYPGIYNYGEIYTATHGRGLFKSLSFVGFKEIEGNTNSFNSNIKIYPNPVSSIANIEFELKNVHNVAAKIFDMNGRLIKTINFGELSAGIRNETINVNGLQPGIYILQLISGKDYKISKFIIR